ncbi:Gram-negative bacteria-binding protein 3, partial [Lucilia cuprina]
MLAPQEECFANIVQDFLICTTIHKARQLGIFQNSIYVRITLDKMIRHTRTYENSENPYFNEYFVFEIKCTLMELLRLTILYEVKKHTSCKKNPTLGELLIDVQSVWNQPNRCYFKKWGRLEAPVGQTATFEGNEKVGGAAAGGGKGFLQIDLAIVTQASNPNNLLKPIEDDLLVLNKWQIHQDYDDIEKNLLQNIDTGVRCNIRYTVTFYRGIMFKKSDYVIQFRFHPFKGKTNVAKNTQDPCWNQEICFVWCYPSLAETLAIELLMHEHLQWKCVAEYEIHFNEIAFKDKPSLGPTFIHLYDNNYGYKYIGRLLMEVKSECLETESNHVMTLKKVSPLDEKRYWQEQQLLIEFLPLQGDFIHSSNSNAKIGLKLGEHNSNFIECSLKNYSTQQNNKQYPIKIFKYFHQQAPYKSITLTAQLPDNRKKFQCDIKLQELMDFVKSEIELFKLFQIQYEGHQQSQMKVLRAILQTIVQKMEHVIESKGLDCISFKQATQWDINRLLYLKEYFHKILEDLKTLRSKLKPSLGSYTDLVIDEAVVDLTKCCHELQNLLSTSLHQDNWPDLIIVLSGGNKELGFCKVNSKNFLYSMEIDEENCNSQCWKQRNFIFKDTKCQHTCLNCGCTVAIIRGCLSIVAESETSHYLSQVVQDWKHPEPFYWSPHIPCVNFKCRLFIHQAKIKPGADRNGLCDPYIRIMISQNAAETPIIFSSLSPIWNAVISLENIQLPGDFLWYLSNPPVVAVEVYDTDRKTTDDYLGCGILTMSVIKSDWIDWYARENGSCESEEVKNKHAVQKYELLKYLTPPPLKWIPIALDGCIRAEVLMSGELVELQDVKKIKEVLEESNEVSVTVGIPNAIKPNMKNFVLEVVFAGFRNYRKHNYLTSKHQVKLMMADLTLTSGLSTSPIQNSLNFLILYASGVLNLPEQLEYWPAIIATDLAISSRGQETTLGATLIANSKRYLQKENAIPCIHAEDYFEMDSVSTTIQLEEESENEHEISDNKPLIRKESQNSYWQNMLKKLKLNNKDSKENAEELNNFHELLDESEFNWWTKFYNSGFLEPCTALSDFKHKLCIYQNELEKQPEFSYLNDWAEPHSMVHGIRYKKNALPKEEIYATLKLHIKITPCICGRSQGGGDGDGQMLKPLASALNPRYQAQLQSLAELVKIMVRVYIVQGLQLRPCENNTQADSYVKVQLGQKYLTNRADYIPNQSNPVFGKCFQLEGMLPSLIPCYWTYEVPTATIKVFYPKGFEVSIPHEEGITLFAFHGKLNEEMEGLEAGTWAVDIIKPKNGRWIFRERNTQLKFGDTLYYWTYVIYNGLGYREDNGVYVVQQYDNTTTTSTAVTGIPTKTTPSLTTNRQCSSAVTIANGAPVLCGGQIIFNENFDGHSLDSKHWSLERRIPQQPDYEFNMYLDDVSDVLQVHNGILTIKPKPISQHYHADVLRKTFSLGSKCTGKLDTDECVFHPKTQNKLNPLITAQINTKGKFSFKYGRVEIKAKVPGAMWVYPQLWLEPSKHTYGTSEYHSGQMRVAHTIANGEDIMLQGGLILNANEPWRSAKMCEYQLKHLNLTHDFHLYELNWTPDSITVAVDGQEYCCIKITDEKDAFKNMQLNNQYLPNQDLLNGGSNWAPFDEEFYLTLGYGIGGNNDFKDELHWKEEKPWPNTDPRSKNKFWKKFSQNLNWLNNGDLRVDYVKVYAVEHILEVSVFNRRDIKDETIGSTFIDLEDRWRTKHRATVGIANEYSCSGYNRWHDYMLPSEILKDLCKNNDLRPPKVVGNTIEVDGVAFEDETEIATAEDLQERLSLTVLRNFQHLPSFGYKLVPQHVETRSLYRNECPGIEQGKIQLWIELYDGNLNIPPPIDITPQPPQIYELRVIIYNVTEVVLQEKNIFGTAMSDIYIKGWCSNFDESQNTDIHYRSINGEGNFNWRMLFPLKYSNNEDMLVTKHRSGLMEEYELKQPAILSLQIWDNDFMSPDDFLGSLEINLSSFPEPYESAKKCELLDATQSITSYGSTTTRVTKKKSQRKLINLFKEKKVSGWFPIRGNLKDSNKMGHIGLAGKINLELEILTETESKLNPVGLGRNGPHALEEPKRPKTSFNPFSNPFKAVKHILFPKLKKVVFILLILFIVGFALLQLVAKFP